MNLEIVAKPVHLGTYIAYLNKQYCEVITGIARQAEEKQEEMSHPNFTKNKRQTQIKKRANQEEIPAQIWMVWLILYTSKYATRLVCSIKEDRVKQGCSSRINIKCIVDFAYFICKKECILSNIVVNMYPYNILGHRTSLEENILMRVNP